MANISIPKNPTAAQLRAGINQRFELETSNNESLKWKGSDEQDKAQTSILNARDSALALVKKIEAVGANATPAEQQLLEPFKNAWLDWLATIVRNGNSTDTRKLATDNASSQVATAWQNIQNTVQSASDTEAVIQDALSDIGQVVSFVNEIGTVAIDAPLASYGRAALQRLYAGKTWSALTDDQRATVTVQALSDAGLTDVAEAVEFLGTISLGISVIVAFWQAADDANNYFSSLSESLLNIGAGQVGGNLASQSLASSDAADVLFDAFGADADLLAAVIPTGFGIIGGIVFAALADILFSLIFGSGNGISPNLEVSLTVPLTTATS